MEVLSVLPFVTTGLPTPFVAAAEYAASILNAYPHAVPVTVRDIALGDVRVWGSNGSSRSSGWRVILSRKPEGGSAFSAVSLRGGVFPYFTGSNISFSDVDPLPAALRGLRQSQVVFLNQIPIHLDGDGGFAGRSPLFYQRVDDEGIWVPSESTCTSAYVMGLHPVGSGSELDTESLGGVLFSSSSPDGSMTTWARNLVPYSDDQTRNILDRTVVMLSERHDLYEECWSDGARDLANALVVLSASRLCFPDGARYPSEALVRCGHLLKDAADVFWRFGWSVFSADAYLTAIWFAQESKCESSFDIRGYATRALEGYVDVGQGEGIAAHELRRILHGGLSTTTLYGVRSELFPL